MMEKTTNNLINVILICMRSHLWVSKYIRQKIIEFLDVEGVLEVEYLNKLNTLFNQLVSIEIKFNH